MAGFFFRLELGGRDAGRPARSAHGRTELERRRHDPAERGQDVSRDRDSNDDADQAPVLVVEDSSQTGTDERVA